MKLIKEKRNLDLGEMVSQEAFSIGNVGMLMEIVTSKIYTNPIKILVQEVISNARDAHREFGNPDEPVMVTLPTRANPSLIIRDFGIGIDPYRMENIFIKYGKSTKRGTNDQTGGFGLGAKSPLAYSDNFQIETWVPDKLECGYEGIVKRVYSVFLNDSGRPILGKASEEPSDGKRGTSIIVPCKSVNDIPTFKMWLKEVCKYWTVKPIVEGMEWDLEDPLVSGDGWDLYDGIEEPFALVDEIPYPIRLRDIFREEGMGEEIKAMKELNLAIHFKTGEVGMTASREELEFKNKRALSNLRSRMMEVYNDIPGVVQAKFAEIDDMTEANLFWKDLPWRLTSMLKSTPWKDIKVPTDTLTYVRDSHGFSITRYEPKDDGGIKAKKVTQVPWERNSAILEKDLPEKGYRPRIQTFFEENPDCVYAYVIVEHELPPDSKFMNSSWEHDPKTGHSNQVLKLDEEGKKKWYERREARILANNFQYRTIDKVSNYEKPKKVIKSSTTSGSCVRKLTYVMGKGDRWGYRGSGTYQMEETTLTTETKGVYVIGSKYKFHTLIGGEKVEVTKSQLESIFGTGQRSRPEVPVLYCVPTREVKSLGGGMIPFYEYLIDKVDALINHTKVEEAYKYQDQICRSDSYEDNLKKVFSAVESDDSGVSNFHVLRLAAQDYGAWDQDWTQADKLETWMRMGKPFFGDRYKARLEELEQSKLPERDWWGEITELYPTFRIYEVVRRMSKEQINQHIKMVDVYRRNYPTEEIL